MVCVVRKHHPLIRKAPSLEQYVALSHLLISWKGSPVGIIDDHLLELGLKRRVKLVVPNFLSAPLIVAKTEMILSLPYRIAEEFKKFAPLEIYPVPFELPAYDLVMIWHPLRDKDPAHLWLRDKIMAIGRNMNSRLQDSTKTEIYRPDKPAAKALI